MSWTDPQVPDPSNPDSTIPGNDIYTDSGWCNEPYVDSDGPADFSLEAVGTTMPYRYSREYHADKRYIVTVRPTVRKTNVNGTADYADNGDLVQFRIQVGAAGSDLEALGGVRLVDDLNNTNYEFVRPRAGGATGAR